jgi:predicted nucleic acid-binding protein
MKDKIFLDTNVIVYAHDRSSGKKNTIAMEIMEYLWERKKGVISVQVMQEFYVCVTTKILKPLPLKVAGNILEYLLNWDLIINDEYITIKAIDLQEKYRFSFWDSLIVQSAIQSQAYTLFSEDLSDGQIIENVKIVNPFVQEWKNYV